MITKASIIEDLTTALSRIQYGDLDNVTLSECEETIVNALDFLKEQSTVGWISVNDKLPEKYENVITFDKYSGVKENWIISKTNGLISWSRGFHITHWIPLPEPPKE